MYVRDVTLRAYSRVESEKSPTKVAQIHKVGMYPYCRSSLSTPAGTLCWKNDEANTAKRVALTYHSKGSESRGFKEEYKGVRREE